jgi:galactose mutarotase-like enzyme
MNHSNRNCNSSIREVIYRGHKAVEIESKQMKLIILPELGAKIVSLQFLATEKEWLVGSGPKELLKVDYGSEFVAADVSGWDECFPGIIAGEYPNEGMYQGRMIPDHGELWSVPWDAHTDGGALVCTVMGRQLPYQFTRKISVIDEHTLRLEYEVANLCKEPLSVFWAAHPLFIGTEYTQICLPNEVSSILCVDGGQALKTGQRYPWPEGNGSRTYPDLADAPTLQRRLDQLGPATARDARKFYVEGEIPEGWAGLYESNNGNYLVLEWDTEAIPYLGIWIDEGVYNPNPVCALEPTNGYYDSLSEANQHEKLLTIMPEDTARWSLSLTLGNGSLDEMYGGEGREKGRV